MSEHVVVVGGGTMGTGIAYVCAQAGYDTLVVEPDDARAAALDRACVAAAQDGVRRGKQSEAQASATLGRLRRVTKLADVPSRPAVAVETVSERLELKHRLLPEIAALQPALLGTNTSAMSIDELAQVLPDRSIFLGTHFFQPVWSFKFMEIVRGAATSDTAVEAARAFATRIDKLSIVVNNVPGFATSRLDLISSLEAMRMLEDGVASVEDIDRASLLAFRHPIGPLRLSDMVGLDVRLDIARVLEKHYGERYAPPRILIEKVARGELGRKSGQGFYAWPEETR